eukprot:CAMPEP_0204530302 /NCGR_PEP_ID=MMETSP0661-20131031/10546_1 /ASSEMBLY_ACC=CAM_ASM_000606 /TAXON_ID=109239 /ORGANISM="Alexandrium margalefi, Strain AMGDE01CS-322" /LENGTH=413 /DNA_ID=CAMNT_0051536387 /DNA_START=97 /DNA_END=1338 /DNA_ORIENTATION=-
MAAACLEAPPEACHGRCFGFEAERAAWPAPRLVADSSFEARPGYESMGASEYEDTKEALRGKARAFARLLRSAGCRVVYSGAGLSTAAGIDDYATRSEASVSGGPLGRGPPPTGPGSAFRSPFCAQPTLAHRALVAMHGAGLLQYWVNQNHDGLPQKAGLPQECINEIHGAWHAPDNPVVMMSGELRQDLLSELREAQDRADLVLAVGTSLCGMNADSLVQEPARRAARGEQGKLGSVIVGLQQTVYDGDATLRIFARCDDFFAVLAEELALAVPPALPDGSFYVPPALAGRGEDDLLFEGLRYDAAGRRSGDESVALDLRDGAELVITGGDHTGAVGELDSRDREGNFRCRFRLKPKTGKLRAPVAMLLGRWWVQAAVDATVPRLPVVNKPSGEAAGQAVDWLRQQMQTYAQ